MSRAAALLFAIVCLRDLFRDLPLPDRLRRRFLLRRADGRWRTAIAAAHRIAIDIALIALFGLQHSVMARPRFKARWTKIVPPPIERSIFVLAASIALMILFLFWRPIDTIVWNVTSPIASGHSMGRVLDRMADRAGQHLPDQPFRAVRIAAGLAARARARSEQSPSSGSPASIAGSRTRSTAASSSPSGRRRR